MSSKIKLFYSVTLCLLIIGINSCKKSGNTNVGQKSPAQVKVNREISVDEVKKILGKNFEKIERGKFAKDSTSEVVAGTEYNSAKLFGIKFSLLGNYNDTLKIIYQTELLNGSFKDCLVDKIKLKNMGYDLIYYNSRDYFMGSGGGDIFSYVIDFSKKQVYTAHFFTVPDKPVSLYISPNTEDESIRNFLIGKYKKDYPELKIVNKDYKLEDIF